MPVDIDHDTETMTPEQLVAEVKKLRHGIRKHRDAEGHNLCWYVPELWALLPERIDPKPRVPPVGEFLENCAKYRSSFEDSALVQPLEWVRGEGLKFRSQPPITVPFEKSTLQPEAPEDDFRTPSDPGAVEERASLGP